MRVSVIFVLKGLISLTNLEVLVATPESRASRFKATRSAVRILAAFPEIMAKVSPLAARLPSLTLRINFKLGSTVLNTSLAKTIPQSKKSSLAIIFALMDAFLGIVKAVVISPRPISSSKARIMIDFAW